MRADDTMMAERRCRLSADAAAPVARWWSRQLYTDEAGALEGGGVKDVRDGRVGRRDASYRGDQDDLTQQDLLPERHLAETEGGAHIWTIYVINKCNGLGIDTAGTFHLQGSDDRLADVLGVSDVY